LEVVSGHRRTGYNNGEAATGQMRQNYLLPHLFQRDMAISQVAAAIEWRAS
jgi:hypothetical protein